MEFAPFIGKPKSTCTTVHVLEGTCSIFFLRGAH